LSSSRAGTYITALAILSSKSLELGSLVHVGLLLLINEKQKKMMSKS